MTAASSSPGTPRRRRWWLLLLGLPTLVVCGCAGDLAYALWVRQACQRWERTVQWDPAGIRERCHEFTLGQGDTALLLIHGFSDNPGVWRPLAGKLAAQGYTCRALRLPGHAMPMARYQETSLAAWRASVKAELHALRADHRRVVIVAHSLGGALALDCLLTDPQAADAVVLLAPLIKVSDQRSPLLKVRTWFWLTEHLVIFTQYVAVPWARDGRDAALSASDPFVPRVVFRGLFRLCDDLAGRGAQFRTPFLLVTAANDDTVDSQAARAWLAASPATPKVVREQPAAGHMLMIDNGWERLATDVNDFIRRLPQ